MLCPPGPHPFGELAGRSQHIFRGSSSPGMSRVETSRCVVVCIGSFFGYVLEKNGREDRYAGFIERPGVRYFGTSEVFVIPEVLSELRQFLDANRIDHATVSASLGAPIF